MRAGLMGEPFDSANARSESEFVDCVIQVKVRHVPLRDNLSACEIFCFDMIRIPHLFNRLQIDIELDHVAAEQARVTLDRDMTSGV